MLWDAGVGQLQQDFSCAFHNVQQVSALVALPDQVLSVAEGTFRQARLQHLEQVILHKYQDQDDETTTCTWKVLKS